MKRPIIYADGLGDPNLITNVSGRSNRHVLDDGLTYGGGLSDRGFNSFWPNQVKA